MSTIYISDVPSADQIGGQLRPRLCLWLWSIVPNAAFWFCIVFIGTVSAWDAWLVEANSEILNAERNPVCEFLISMNPESKVYFFLAKAASSSSVLAVLVGLNRFRYRHTMLITASIALFQLGLLTHLYLSDNLCGGLPNFALLFRETPETVFAFRFQ